MTDKPRCAWANRDELERDYHDREWGVPVRDDRTLFEFLCLEGAQAGLSWRTVLAKRPAYREFFHDFDIAKIAAMSDAELENLLKNPAIIRNRLKVFGFRKNAQAALNIIDEQGSLSDYLWQFASKIPRHDDIPATTPESDAMSKQLKKDGFTFVGSTICYALMQAVGMMNDHEKTCFRFAEIERENHA
jgi:DNA-3-methyladenine glycosylase I